MSLLSMKEYEFTKGNKVNTKSIWYIEATNRIRAKRHVKEEQYEDVFNFVEILLTMYEMDVEINQRRGNTNA